MFYVELFIELNEDFPSLAGDLRDEPTTVLQSLGLAVSQVASFNCIEAPPLNGYGYAK